MKVFPTISESILESYVTTVVALLKERTYAVAPVEAPQDKETESTLDIVSPDVSYNTSPSKGDDKTG